MKTTLIPFSPVRKRMAELGAIIVEKDAVKFLNDFLENTAREIVRESLALTKFAGRKKVKVDDIEFVVKKNYPYFLNENRIDPNAEGFLATHPMRVLFDEENANIVARQSVEYLNRFLELIIEKVTLDVVKLLNFIQSRKKITKKDLQYVLSDITKSENKKPVVDVPKKDKNLEYFPYSPMIKFAHDLGIDYVQKEAIDYLNRFLEKLAQELTAHSMTYSSLAERKKIMQEDLEFAIKKHFEKEFSSFSSTQSEYSIFAIAPLRRLMKDKGAVLVAESAVKYLSIALTYLARSILLKAKKLLDKSELKRLSKDFIQNSISLISGKDIPTDVGGSNGEKKKKSSKTSKNQKICPFCNNICSPNAKFCPKCGDPFD